MIGTHAFDGALAVRLHQIAFGKPPGEFFPKCFVIILINDRMRIFLKRFGRTPSVQIFIEFHERFKRRALRERIHLGCRIFIGGAE